MNKRVFSKGKKKIALLLAAMMLFPSEAAAASSPKTIQKTEMAAKYEVAASTETTPEATQTAAVSEPTVPATTPALSPSPSVTPSEEPPEITEPPKVPVSKPKKLTKLYLCSLGKHKVEVSWEEAEYAESYQVYRRKKGAGKYRLLGTVDKCSYRDKKLAYNRVYQYRVIPIARDGETIIEGKGKSIIFQNKKIVSTGHQKYTYKEMKSDIVQFGKNYHGLVTYKVIGKSEDGRNIYDVILGNENAQKTMLVVAALHAREYMTSLLCMNQIEYYLQNSQGKVDGKKVEKVLSNMAIHYVTMANPDGVTISQSGINGIHSAKLRKNLRKIRRGSTRVWKANARGVDLNRNFPYLFQRSGKRSSAGYTGPYAASEKETKAIVSLIDDLRTETRLQGVVNYHAMGSIVFGDCRQSAAHSMKQAVSKMYQVARSTTGYRSAAGYQGATALGRGCLREYVMYGLGIPSITVEVGRTPCPVPQWEFPSIWQRNRKLVLRVARLFT